MNRLIPLLPLALLAACAKPAENQAPAEATSSAPAPAGVTGGSPSIVSASASAAAKSHYTSLKDCEVSDSNEGEDWSQSLCDGPGGWTLQIDYADARDDATLLHKGRPDQALGIQSLTGGGFNSLGDTVEWRGGKPDQPAALIMRNSVSEDPEDSARTTSYLLVVDLAQGCIVGKVPPQAGQNEKARALADGPKQVCLKAGR